MIARRDWKALALARSTLAVCLLISAAHLASAEPERLADRLATLQAKAAGLDGRLETLLQENQERIRALQARLGELRRQRPRPQAELDRVEAALEKADDRTLGLIAEHGRLREQLDGRIAEVSRQLEQLPAAPQPPPPHAHGQGAAPCSCSALPPPSERQLPPSPGATTIERRNGLGNLVAHHLNGEALDSGTITIPAGFPQPVTPGQGTSSDPSTLSNAERMALQRQLADELTRAMGTANEADRALVAERLSLLPVQMLQQLKAQGTVVAVARDSVTDIMTELKGVQPRGWPPGMTWDSVPGLYDPSRNMVIVATRGHGTSGGARIPPSGDGHGSYDLVLHEAGHAVDRNGRYSQSPDFAAARGQDFAALTAYQQQSGVAGPEETYAEQLARYYGGDPAMAREHPALFNYFMTREGL